MRAGATVRRHGVGLGCDVGVMWISRIQVGLLPSPKRAPNAPSLSAPNRSGGRRRYVTGAHDICVQLTLNGLGLRTAMPSGDLLAQAGEFLFHRLRPAFG